MNKLTRQILTLLKEKSLSFRQLFNGQTVTKYEERLGSLLRNLEDRHLIIRKDKADKNQSIYTILPTGLVYLGGVDE